MTSEALQQARDFEAKYMPYIPREQRPVFHVTGGIGWINDPNGFSIYQGEYHLFYQYHPYSTKWGPMHWGHVKTSDFIRWERLPIAIAPDTEYDGDGCFSGSAIELPDGRQLLMYTGVRRIRQEDGVVNEYQTQCIAVGDGVNYEKYEGNPVLSGKDLPEGGSALDFRDPKIWREDNTYYAVAGNRTSDGSGSILLYESKDAFHWSFGSILDACRNQYGRMWECPDFFPLDGNHVLLTSPQEMTPVGLEFHAGNGTVCLIGHYDSKQKQFVRSWVQAIDYGIDFYAPQTLETPDGRRIMIAWMQNWETSNCQPTDIRCFGEMTLPRELHISNGRLVQNPVRELEQYRRNRIAYQNVILSGETNLHGISGRVIDMTVTVRPANQSSLYQWFKLKLAEDGEHMTVIRYKLDCNTVRVDRTRCGFPHDIVHVRDFLVRPQQGIIKFRVILDRHSLELFVNDGEQAATFILYTPETASAISFEASEAVLLDVEKYDLVIDSEDESYV
ncbi:MAG: glycoside hydrolase family 32 protein [Candidatus Onthomonas sp.]